MITRGDLIIERLSLNLIPRGTQRVAWALKTTAGPTGPIGCRVIEVLLVPMHTRSVLRNLARR